MARLRTRVGAPDAREQVAGRAPHLVRRHTGGGERAELLGRRAEVEADEHSLRRGAVAGVHGQREHPSGALDCQLHGRGGPTIGAENAGAAMCGDRVHGRRDRHRPPIHGENPVAMLEHALRGRALLGFLHGCRRDERLDRGVDVAERQIAVVVGAREDRPEDRERDQEVHAGTGEDHDDALPRRLVAVGAGGHLRVHALELFGIHAGDLHVPPRGDRADHVLGLPPADADELGREEQREPLHAHADRLGGEKVPQLVQHDQRHDAEDRQGPAHALSLAGASRIARRLARRGLYPRAATASPASTRAARSAS